MSDKIIRIKDLTIKDSNDNVLVNNISIDINKGEIFGIVGESGSGKTLTAKYISNIIPDGLHIDVDTMEFMGKDIKNISQKEKRDIIGKNIGFIPQNTVFYLHPMIKIKDQIGDGYIYHMKKSKKEAIGKAMILLGNMGFDNPKDILNYYPWQLSGGMRQRVNIAMAMMNDPNLIIADEPTTALDSTIQKQVADLFQKINEEMGITILLISHDLGLIKHYCNSIAVMYAGQVAEKGSSKELFENPKHPYTKLLIKIIPTLSMKKNEKLSEIPGFVPEKGRSRSGCIFKSRCPSAMEECEKNVKEHVAKNGHYYKCNIE